MLAKLFLKLEEKIEKVKKILEIKTPDRLGFLLATKLFVLEISLSLTQYLLILFHSSSQSFKVLIRQPNLQVCPYSFTNHKQFQKKVRIFSIAGFFALISATVITSLTLNLFLGPTQQLRAATYTFTQTSWSGGATANNATHTSNQTGWNEYSAKDASLTTVNSGADLQLSGTAGSKSHTSDTDFNNTTAQDLSGNDNDGTLTNMDPVTDYTTGQIGGALDFDGVNDWVNVGSITPTISGAYTESFWIKGDQLTAYDQIISHGWYHRFLYIGGTLFFNVDGDYGGAAETTCLSGNSNWHFITGINTGSTQQIYCDGQLKNTASEIQSSFGNNVAIGISADSSIFSQTTIDDVRIYNRALSSAEVTQLYNSSSSTVDPTGAGGVVGYWSFDNGPSLSNSTVTGTGSGAKVDLAEDTTGLVGRWKFDENASGNASGQTLTDSAGSNNGTGSGTDGPTWTTGQIGTGALSFDGVDDSVGMNAISGASSSQGTVSAWFMQPTAEPGFILQTENDPNRGYILVNGDIYTIDTTLLNHTNYARMIL